MGHAPLSQTIFFTTEKLEKQGFPPFVWALVASQNMPPFWKILNTPLTPDLLLQLPSWLLASPNTVAAHTESYLSCFSRFPSCCPFLAAATLLLLLPMMRIHQTCCVLGSIHDQWGPWWHACRLSFWSAAYYLTTVSGTKLGVAEIKFKTYNFKDNPSKDLQNSRSLGLSCCVWQHASRLQTVTTATTVQKDIQFILNYQKLCSNPASLVTSLSSWSLWS